MPVQTRPEDTPAIVCFHIDENNGFEVTVTNPPQQNRLPYRIEGGSPHFESRDNFKARVVQTGLTPAVAEDPGRTFNATARQLRELGFAVEMAKEASDPHRQTQSNPSSDKKS